MAEQAAAAPAAAAASEAPTPAAAAAEAAPVADVAATEAAPVAETPAEPAKERFNPRTREFAALTRKEREVRAKEASLNEKLAKVTEYEKAQQLARNDPDAYLRQAGLTYDDVTRWYLNGKSVPPEQKLKQFEDTLSKQEQTIKQHVDAALATERQKQNEARAISDFVAKIDKVIQTSPDYELIRSYEATDQVYQLIDLHYANYNELLDIDVAAKKVEAVLLEKKEEEAKKLLGIEKIKRKVAPTPPPDAKASSKPNSSPPAPGRTITNAMTASTSAPAKPLSPDDRWLQIMARARAQQT